MKRAISLTTSARFDRNTFLNLITKTSSFFYLKQIHAQIIHSKLSSDLITVTKLTQKLCDLGQIHHANLLVSSTRNSDLFLYNVLIRGFSLNHLPASSVAVFAQLCRETSIKPNNFTYVFAISAASGLLQDQRVGLSLHGKSIVGGFGSDLYVGSAVVGMYLNFSRVGDARKVFDEMSERDTALWNAMISGLVKNCCYFDSIRVFRDMVCSGVCLDSSTLSTILPAVAELPDLKTGTGIHCVSYKLGLNSHIYVLTGFISFYSKCRDPYTAEVLFRQMRKPDVACYNAIISGFISNGDVGAAVGIFRELLYYGEKVNSTTIVGLIPVGSPFGHSILTSLIHGLSVKIGIIGAPVSTAILTVYSRVREIGKARQLFDESPEKSLAAWNAMISGYTQNGLTEQAVRLFQEMQTCRVRPSPTTISSILSACAQLGALSLGKWVHNMINEEKLESNVYVTTALIDMYAKCGSISKARELFDTMPEKNVVSWTVMVSGYGLHGLGQEALNLFHKMFESGVTPSRVTFLCVLYACSHAGLVDEGNKIFDSMVNVYGCEPVAEHYACMVDLFGRAGQLEKALQFIENMPVQAGSVEWGALLGACMVHKDIALARKAADKLLELDPENVGYYVLLSNIYTADRKFGQAASVRQMAKKRNLAKSPGCTLIELGETPYVFTCGDRSHPQTTEIYARLEKLMTEIKEAGYQAETVTFLHDIEEEEKELMVNVHSEKLAIAFALLSTEPGTEIRIFKNLRVCLDCHSATKYISKVTQRVIVVRDANRFHHFEDGVCSCGDYW